MNMSRLGPLGALLFFAVQSAPSFAETWEAIMCRPAMTCTGDCRPYTIARPAGGAPPIGCNVVGVFPSFEMAKRNADMMSGRMPSFGTEQNFEFYFREGERLRTAGDSFNARAAYQNAARQSNTLEEQLYSALGLIAVNDIPTAVNVLNKARDLASSKAQYTLVGDAYAKAGRNDLAQFCYSRARSLME